MTVNTIAKVNKIIEKYHLKEVPNSYINLTLPALKKYSKPKPRLPPATEHIYHLSGVATCDAIFGAYNVGIKATKEYRYEKEIAVAFAIRATSLQQAKEKFNQLAIDDLTVERRRDIDSPSYFYRNVLKVEVGKSTKQTDDIFIDDDDNKYSLTNESSHYMQRSKPVDYNFIPNDEKYNTNENFCVPDTFLGIYSPLIKSLTLTRFTNLCYEVRGEVREDEQKINLLDVGINENGTFVLECHNFFSCGFYGFSNHQLIPLMFKSWFRECVK